ncbi:hypothetical protein [Corynebacterium pacaense]|uniref:hypothetical protein n=1 Tax=Corynebacterium pacaense TaxID=1816684 RepID=UPI0009BC3C91|nr:hypothetical protein [Corynebacterium pacaense]
MSTTVMIITMSSVFIGFLFFGGAFASFMYKKPQAQIWTLFSVAIVLITVIPVVIAVGWGTLIN